MALLILRVVGVCLASFPRTCPLSLKVMQEDSSLHLWGLVLLPSLDTIANSSGLLTRRCPGCELVPLPSEYDLTSRCKLRCREIVIAYVAHFRPFPTSMQDNEHVLFWLPVRDLMLASLSV